MTQRPGLRCLVLAAMMAILANPAQAALYDEIQVYDDSINEPRETGLELHVNTTPSGRVRPDYPGEIPPANGLRVTPEFSHGLTRTLEAGLYLPTLLDRNNRFYAAGVKLRLKWIPRRAPESGGFFYGANFELSRVGQRFEQSRAGFELRPILGYRDSIWLLAANPVLGYDLSAGYRQGGFDFSPAVKISRRVSRSTALGIETYSDLGKLSGFAPRSQQNHTLYGVIDFDHAPWSFNLGIGRGLNPATDRWTIKAIFDIPL